jgi:hypothetical protein
MFAAFEKVICIDDTNPNPICSFPAGYVVRGCVYIVRGTGPGGGVQIEGKPVRFSALPGIDTGWKRHRFRKCGGVDFDKLNDFVEDPEYASAGT